MKVEDYPFVKELITDTEGTIQKVVIDFSDYQRLLEAIEDKGLMLAMMEVKDENPLNLDEALAELQPKSQRPPLFGTDKATISISDDFDAPLEEFED